MIEQNNGYDTFQLYMALKFHFTGKYDFFKYGGKVKTTKDIFMKRKDRYSFHRLSRKYDIIEMRNYMVANFINDNGNWIGDMLDAEGEEHYRDWTKTQQSLSYIFENDLIKLLNSVDNPNQLLEVKPGCYPILLSEAMGNSIKLETLIILNYFMNFCTMWNNNIDDDIIWPNYYMKCVKYAPFIEYDKSKFKKILVKNLTQ